jgi:hypothetical protein
MTVSPRERHNGATTEWTPRQHTSRDADELDSDALPLTRYPTNLQLTISIRRTPLVKSAFLLLYFGGILYTQQFQPRYGGSRKISSMSALTLVATPVRMHQWGETQASRPELKIIIYNTSLSEFMNHFY